MNRKFLSSFFFFTVVVAAVFMGTFLLLQQKKNPTTRSDSPAKRSGNLLSQLLPNSPAPSPSPDPFAGLTLPYLQQRIYQSNLGEMQKISETATHINFLTSYTSDGLTIHGLLTQPKGEMPEGGWPAVVFIHGYIPPTQYRTQEKYQEFVNYLARNDLVVFKIDLRGHGNSEGEPGGAYYSSDYVIDALNARAALQNAEFVHPDKIGLWGHSMAGNIVLRALAAQPEIRAGVIWAGAVYTYQDMQDFGIQDSSYQAPRSGVPQQQRRAKLFESHGSFEKDNPFWRQVPATNYLQDVSGAVQIHHAVNDDVVSIEYSRNLAPLLETADVAYELHEYPSGGHNLTGAAFSQAMQRTVEFLQVHLTGN